MNREELRKISIPNELYSRLNELLPSTGASSIDELASRALRDWLSKEGARSAEKGRMSKTDEKAVEERLKSLGYL